MIQLITPASYQDFSNVLADMYRLRYRTFKVRLDWDVVTSGDLEVDEFDALSPVYLVQFSSTGQVRGSVRLLPTLGPTMLRDTFPVLLGGQPAPSSPLIWESSRFAIDVTSDEPKGQHGLARSTYELFAGMIEFGLSRRLAEIVTVTDTRMERILRRAGWPLRPLGSPCRIDNTLAIAGALQVSHESLLAIRTAGHLAGPALWTPVVAAVA
ncbi:conjugal transfer protein TraI [Bradyrhizobium sp. 149]|uniref:acyl-homoserine-lactone synthase n=1 Tax=Bradyrhizobium sp. 149 TaxID=2782624 RepID=UPI001FFB1C17|nr:acyl-homoserine-lactone synthase [Bradyrhizobium sp. 149]MCK1655341.1 conjugal transfer protein TraI [Bradyrhizobium sp. 149]